MEKIVKKVVLWLIGKYLPGWHLHRDPARKIVPGMVGKSHVEMMAGNQEEGK